VRVVSYRREIRRKRERSESKFLRIKERESGHGQRRGREDEEGRLIS
jgi:hypothetical protein